MRSDEPMYRQIIKRQQRCRRGWKPSEMKEGVNLSLGQKKGSRRHKTVTGNGKIGLEGGIAPMLYFGYAVSGLLSEETDQGQRPLGTSQPPPKRGMELLTSACLPSGQEFRSKLCPSLSGAGILPSLSLAMRSFCPMFMGRSRPESK